MKKTSNFSLKTLVYEYQFINETVKNATAEMTWDIKSATCIQ